MNRIPPNDQDYDNDEMMHDSDHDDLESDYDNFDDDMSSPIGRLMDDDVGFENEPSAYVSGYSRNQAPEAAAEPKQERSAPPPRRRRERPVVGFGENTEPRRRPKPEPIQELTSDDDFYEAGIREARRRRPQNPDPRPAVRAAVPTPRRMAAPPRRQPNETDETNRREGPPPEDSYDTFRQRYRGELISSGANRGGGGGERPAARRPQLQGDARGGYAPARAREDNDTANLMRVGIIAGIFVVLAVLIILIIRINTLASRNGELQDTVDNMQGAYARYNQATSDRDAHASEIQRQNAEINRLNSELAALRAENMPGGAGGGGQASGDGTPNETQPPTDPPPQWPQTHTIVSGDNLGRIARNFYGTSDPVYVAHIAEYNNIRDPNNIPLGRTITIPAPPGTAQ